jgi:hypothetical protein
MGCWNGTCMISNLPIMGGEDVKLVILKKNKYSDVNIENSSSYTYGTDILMPLFLPINGKYNSYGAVEDIVEDWNSDLIMKTLKEMLGGTIKYDIDTINENWTLKDVIDGIERGGCRKPLRYLNQKTDKWTPANLSFTLIRKDVWDVAVKMSLQHRGYWNIIPDKEGFYITGEEYSNYTYDALIGTSPSKRRNNKACNRFFNYSEKSVVKTFYLDYLDTIIKDSEKTAAFKKDSIELDMVNTTMEVLRKSWMIQPGSGSQNTDFKLNGHFYKQISEIALEICKEYDEEEED